MDLDRVIEKHALHNAVKYGGKAAQGAVIGAVIAEAPEIKKDMKAASKKIAKIISEVNKMSPEEQLKKLKETAPELLEEKKEEKGLPELKNAEKGKVVTRMPPEPSKYAHIGHALTFLINYLYAEKYGGRCILRFEDTNPERSEQEYVDSIKEDLAWLGIKWDEEVYTSDDMEKFYEYAGKLIESGNAYVSTMSAEKMSECRRKMRPFDERGTPPLLNLKEWKKMLSGEYKENEAALIFKGNMSSKNTVMRDPVLFRISSAKHYKHGNKYRAWPLYDFQNAAEDHLCGITHVLRSNEFELRTELQNKIKSLLDLEQQEITQYGRFNVTGATTRGREIREMIEKKEVLGWDDPRLVTLKALRRRGIQPEAIRNMVEEVGLSKNQTNIDWSMISSANRKVLDKKADRYFFIPSPVKVKIDEAPNVKVKMGLHPGDESRGKRGFTTKQSFYMDRKDFENLRKGKLYRFMECLNFKKTGDGLKYDSLEYEKYKDKGEAIMHYLPDTKALMEVEVLMPDGTTLEGLGEPAMKNIKKGEVIQAERFGFMRLYSKGKKLKFWYTHK